MKTFITILKWVKLGLLILLALAGGFMMLAPRRHEQDYDNEVKTELVEGLNDQIKESSKT
jgi:hypothetical protein